MSASKRRPQWSDLPAPVRAGVEELVGPVVGARNCPGGFSPGFASRLTLAGGGRAFVKAVDGQAWPDNAAMHRHEAVANAALSGAVDRPAYATPALLGQRDDGRWVTLAFEDVDGEEPAQPWLVADLARVVAAITEPRRAAAPSPRVDLPRDHPRLGGWAEIAADPDRRRLLRDRAPWAADELVRLTRLEQAGLVAARGEALVHCDLYPHNVLLCADRVVVVDWAHARLGAPVIDLVTLLASAAADGADPDALLQRHASAPDGLDAVLCAHAGFLLAGGLASPAGPLAAIAVAKLRLGLGALAWLHRRLG